MGGMPPRNFEFAFSPEREREGRERVAGKGNRGERLSSRPSPRPHVHSEATSGALSSR